jgi:uncharacterized protein YbaP (TraB family)
MLWKAADANLSLLGSVHVLDQRARALFPEAERTYAMAQRVAFEHDLMAAPDLSLIENAPGNPLSRQVPTVVFGNAAKEWVNVDLEPERLEQLQPWFAALVIGSRAAARRGIMESHGVDMMLWDRTEQDGKTRTTLEPLEQALSAFSKSPAHEQASFLDYATNPISNLQDDIDAMVNAWHRHDASAIVRIRAHRLRMWPECYGGAILGRNLAWMPLLLDLAADAVPTLVVVGALHCVGEQGLPNLLANAGLRFSRVV